jgi:hypothetical protein
MWHHEDMRVETEFSDLLVSIQLVKNEGGIPRRNNLSRGFRERGGGFELYPIPLFD